MIGPQQGPAISEWIRGTESPVEGDFFLQEHQHFPMAAVVPSASCYTSTQPLQLFGRGHGGGHYLSLFTYRGPRCAPRPRLVCHGPKLTLWQICHMLKVMKQVRKREAAAAAARKQGSGSPAPPSPGNKSERRCAPSCLRHKRSVKRVR